MPKPEQEQPCPMCQTLGKWRTPRDEARVTVTMNGDPLSLAPRVCEECGFLWLRADEPIWTWTH